MPGPSLSASVTRSPVVRPVTGMLGALGRFVYRRRRLVLLGWGILFVVGPSRSVAPCFGHPQGLQRGWFPRSRCRGRSFLTMPAARA